MEIKNKKIFNPEGDIELNKVKLIGGNTTGLLDLNNVKFSWTADWYRQGMNNFWIPEEINMDKDIKDYRKLTEAEKIAYDKIISFLIFLDSVQTTNLPNLQEYITAPDIIRCLTIQQFQELVHSQSYSYILDSVCRAEERTKIIYYWKDDALLLKRNEFIGGIYNDFQEDKSVHQFVRTCIANYILEGIYFYSGFMFFYNLARQGKMSGTSNNIQYINRDENTHLWLFRNMLRELQQEIPEYFTEEYNKEWKELIKKGVEQEIEWGKYVIGNNIEGLNSNMIEGYIKYLGNLRSNDLGFGDLYPEYKEEPLNMSWVSHYSDPNRTKSDFFENKPRSYSKAGALEDDL